MAGLPILSQIETALKSIIEALAPPDYNYDWGTVNEPDMAHQSFPSALVELEPEETSLDDPNGAFAGAYYNEAMFRITVRGELSSEENVPNFAINDILNRALDDLKQAFGINYHLNDTANTIMYRRSVRITEQAGDRFIPKRLETFWSVRYAQDRQNPTQPGD